MHSTRGVIAVQIPSQTDHHPFVKVFKPTRWGSIKVFQAPCAIFLSEPLFPNSPSLKAAPLLTLKPSPLTILLVLYEIAKGLQGKDSDPLASVTVKHELLIERTGVSKNVITRAVRALEAQRFIKLAKQRKKYGEFAGNKYIFCDPSTGEAIPELPKESLEDLPLAVLLNLLFLLRGEWGSLGDYMSTQKGLRTLVGEKLFWNGPQLEQPEIPAGELVN